MESQDQWEEVDSQVWKPENEGDKITGKLVHKSPENRAKDISARFKVENEDGIFLVWGSAIITDKLECIDIGTKIRVTFKGKKDIGKGKTLKVFKVEKLKAPQGMKLEI